MIKPLQDYIILKKEKIENKTDSGIILTHPNEEITNQGTIFALGSKCQNDLKEGMIVIYKEYSEIKISMNDEEYIILKEEDILAILE